MSRKRSSPEEEESTDTSNIPSTQREDASGSEIPSQTVSTETNGVSQEQSKEAQQSEDSAPKRRRKRRFFKELTAENASDIPGMVFLCCC